MPELPSGFERRTRTGPAILNPHPEAPFLSRPTPLVPVRDVATRDPNLPYSYSYSYGEMRAVLIPYCHPKSDLPPAWYRTGILYSYRVSACARCARICVRIGYIIPGVTKDYAHENAHACVVPWYAWYDVVDCVRNLWINVGRKNAFICYLGTVSTQIHIFWRTNKSIVVVQLAIGSGRIRVKCHIPGRDNSRSLAVMTVWF